MWNFELYLLVPFIFILKFCFHFCYSCTASSCEYWPHYCGLTATTTTHLAGGSDTKILNNNNPISNNVISQNNKNSSVIVIGPKSVTSVSSVHNTSVSRKVYDKAHKQLVGSSSSSSSKANSIIFLGECEMPITRERKHEAKVSDIGVRRVNSLNSASTHSTSLGSSQMHQQTPNDVEKKYFSNFSRRWVKIELCVF